MTFPWKGLFKFWCLVFSFSLRLGKKLPPHQIHMQGGAQKKKKKSKHNLVLVFSVIDTQKKVCGSQME